MLLEIQTIQQYCCNCGCLMIIPSDIVKDLKSSQRSFFCLNGHGQSYARSTTQILEEELQKKEQRITQLSEEVYKLKSSVIPNEPKRRAKRKTNKEQ